MVMKQHLDLNRAPVDSYRVMKVLTKSDMTTSQLLLPRNSVDEFIVPNMPDVLKSRLREGDKRVDIWVVDDENHFEFLKMADCDHCYSINWGIVRHSRKLRVGQEMRFCWINHQLHVIVTSEGIYGKAYFPNNEDSEDFIEYYEQNREQGEAEPMNESTNEPVAKRRKLDMDIEASDTNDEDLCMKTDNNKHNWEQGEEEPMDESTDKPVAKRRKIKKGVRGSSLENALPNNLKRRKLQVVNYQTQSSDIFPYATGSFEIYSLDKENISFK